MATSTSNPSRLLLKILIVILALHLIGNTQQQRVRLKTASYISSSSSGSQQTTATNKTLPSINQPMATTISGYKCANYCSCSLIQVISSSKLESRANLTKVVCASAQFSDVLTIDRRTQIIHIILPPQVDNNQPQDNKQVTSTFLSDSIDEQQQQQQQQREEAKFRMPRLAQFGQLREIVIDNLQFELCDSEVFKRGQRLRRLQWNHNQLKHISKACFRYLDHLIDLNLDYNQLDELESALFSDLLSLRSLSIAHNRLSELAAHQFANLTNLVSLNLVGNSFKVINLHLLEPMQNSLRLLILASNEIKSFTYTIIQPPPSPSQATSPQQATNNNNTITFPMINSIKASNTTTTTTTTVIPSNLSHLFSGAIFKNLVKLNVDQNRFERIKLLQLHRFYNVKFLSIRANSIASIRDKAFNGLKLVELNLASNQLQSISRCAFCNSTIKRLVLSHNNLTLASTGVGPLAPLPAASALLTGGSSDQSASGGGQLLTVATASELPQPPPLPPPLPPSSSASMLILSQSLFGPLFGQLEYLDLSDNPQLADQLEWLLEPLLELRYLNLASVGLERSLPSPSLFKNLRHLRYLNLSRNQLDQLISETVEPLAELEVLDLSENKFSELDESLLVTLDDLLQLKLVNFASNPWYCSQCKISPLYDWMLRSPIYNATCMAPLAAAASPAGSPSLSVDQDDDNENIGQDEAAAGELSSGTNYKYRTGQDLSLLTLAEDSDAARPGSSAIDFDLIMSSAGNIINNEDNPQYQLIPTTTPMAATAESNLQQRRGGANNLKNKQLARLIKSLETSQDDQSIRQTLASLPTANKIISTNNMAPSSLELAAAPNMINEYVIVSGVGGGGGIGGSRPSELLSRWLQVSNLCLKCEFPSELRAFNVHELSPADFKYCAGSAPRFSASEPKIGLTLAIVIIGALFCIIVAVIVIYRKKSNAYYPNELDNVTERLDGNHLGAGGKGQPVVSVSSDNEQNQYGDGTDYSSPPLSQSYESYSGNEDDEEEEEEDEEGDEEEEEEDDDEELDEEEEDENEYEDDDQDQDEDGAEAEDDVGGHHLEEVDEVDEPVEQSETTNNDKSLVINSNANLANKVQANNNNKLGIINSSATHQAPPITSSSNTSPSMSVSAGPARHAAPSESLRNSIERQQSSGGGEHHHSTTGRRTANEPRPPPPPPPMASHEADESMHLHGHSVAGGRTTRHDPLESPATPQRVDFRPEPASQMSPAQLSASDLLHYDKPPDDHLFSGQGSAGHQQQAVAEQPHNNHAPKLVQLANVAGSLHGSQSRARSRQDRRTRQERPPDQPQSSSLGPRSPTGELARPNNGQPPPPPPPPAHSIMGAGKAMAGGRQVTHRQSSEHSTAGSVSFAPPVGNSSSSPSNSSPASRQHHHQHQQRRHRLVQASQTIGGLDQAPAHTGNHRNHHHQVAWRSGGGSTESNSGGGGVGHPVRPAGKGAKVRGGHTSSQVRSESRAATVTTMSSPPSSSSPSGRHQPQRRAQVQPATPNEPPAEAGGRQAALRGMPGRRLELSTPEASAGDDSLPLEEAQLADLPSDLDETDVENLLASGGAVVVDDYLDGHDDQYDDQDEEYPTSAGLRRHHHHQLRPGSGGHMHESHSTHSALTQTGSRDFQD